MARYDQIDLGLMLMDRQLLDATERRCGKVDDVDIDADDRRPNPQARVDALVSGPRTWSSGNRGPLAWLFARIAGSGVVRIPWDDVEEIEHAAIKLRRGAPELGLGKGDDRAAQWLRRAPRS